MKKIYVNRNDSATVVVHKILSSPEEEIVIYIPKGSEIISDPKSFKLIRRETSAAGKKVSVESVDEAAIELASVCGFEISDAIFKRGNANLMDIIPTKPKISRIALKKEENKEKGGTVHIHNEDCVHEEDGHEHTEEMMSGFDRDEAISSVFSGRKNNEERIDVGDIDISDEGEEKKPSLALRFLRTLIIFAAVAGIFYVGLRVIPKADIEFVMETADWSFSDNITALVSTKGISGAKKEIPAQIFKISKNFIGEYPASGSKMIEKKAEGKLTIWNAYSSDAQSLVKNTRFLTPEGKVFRITSSIVVPGAKVADGKLVPSSVITVAVADAAGESYNTGAVAKLRIPGFQGTPKYDGFYGEFTEGASGGFVGELKVPTEADIAKAKEETTNKVKEQLAAERLIGIPNEFIIPEGGEEIRTVKEGVTSDPNDKGVFSYGVMLESRAIAFREEDVIGLMAARFSEGKEEKYDLREKDLSFKEIKTDLSAGKISIPVEFHSVWARVIDPEEFKTRIMGMKIADLKTVAFSIPGVKSFKADLWPFYVTSVPKELEKIKVEVK